MKTQVYPTDAVFEVWNDFVCKMLLTDSRLNRPDVMERQEEIEAAGQLSGLREKHRAAVNDLVDKVFRYDEENVDGVFLGADPTLLVLVADRMQCTTEVLMDMKTKFPVVELPESLIEFFLLLMMQELPKA